jgi:hypothetical protein
MGRLKLNGKALPIVVVLLTVLLGVLGWVMQDVAKDVDENSTHRIQSTEATVHLLLWIEDQKKQIGWLENAVRAIHNEAQVERNLLNGIARKIGAQEAPAVKPLPPQEH